MYNSDIMMNVTNAFSWMAKTNLMNITKSRVLVSQQNCPQCFVAKEDLKLDFIILAAG